MTIDEAIAAMKDAQARAIAASAHKTAADENARQAATDLAEAHKALREAECVVIQTIHGQGLVDV